MKIFTSTTNEDHTESVLIINDNEGVTHVYHTTSAVPFTVDSLTTAARNLAALHSGDFPRIAPVVTESAVALASDNRPA